MKENMTENPIEETESTEEELVLTDKEAENLAERIASVTNDDLGQNPTVEAGLTVPLAFKDGAGVIKRIGEGVLNEDGTATVRITEGGAQAPKLMEALFKMNVAILMSTEVRNTEKRVHRRPTPSNHTKKNKKKRKK